MPPENNDRCLQNLSILLIKGKDSIKMILLQHISYYWSLSIFLEESVKFCFFNIFRGYSKTPVVQTELTLYKCGALRDLVAFVQFRKHEKHPWRSVSFKMNLRQKHNDTIPLDKSIKRKDLMENAVCRFFNNNVL